MQPVRKKYANQERGLTIHENTKHHDHVYSKKMNSLKCECIFRLR